MENHESFSTRNLNLLSFETYRQQQLDYEKQKKSDYLKIVIPIAIGILVIMFYYQWFVGCIIALVITLAIYGILIFALKKVYIKKFKNELLTKLVQEIDSNFSYFPEQFVNLAEFRESNIIKSVNSCRGEDYFTGTIQNHPFKGSEITVESGSGKHRHVVFKGMFFSIDYPFSETESIEILPDTAEKIFGSLGSYLQSINMVRTRLVKLENKKFEELFVVYSSNPEMAQHKITGKLAETMVNLHDIFGADIYLSFHKNRMYFAVNNRHDIFKVDINQSLLENKLMEQYYREFYKYIDSINLILTALH